MAEPTQEQTNLIINYLPQTLTDDEFRSMFQSVGPVKSTRIVRDRDTGYSHGYGFVDYENAEDAYRAIETLNGLKLKNKTLKVAYSRTGEDIKGASLYIANVPRDLTSEDLKQIFEPFGKIIQSRVAVDKHTNLSKGIAFVLYSKNSEAQAAIEGLHEKPIPGRTEKLSVNFTDKNYNKPRPPPGAAAPLMGHSGRGYGRGAYARGGPYRHIGGYGDMAGYGYDDYFDDSHYGRYGYGSRGMGGPLRMSGGRGTAARHRFNPMHQGGSTSGDVPEGNILFVYNIGTDADERVLWQLFAPFGAVQKVNIIMDKEKQQCKGYGFVTMTNYQDAVCAIENLDGYYHNGKALQVSFKN